MNVLQPTNLKDPEFISELRALNADVFVVVAFRMLPEVVWAMPPKGTINLHASLLPNYRGAAPINWAIINGETESGVTTFFIEKEIDTGKIIEQSKVNIGPDETVGQLYERLMHLGADVMLHTLLNLDTGMANATSQDELMQQDFKPAPKIFKQDCIINFNQPVESVHNFCRGLSPYPAAWCMITDESKQETKTFKIFGTKVSDQPVDNTSALISSSEGILFPCKDYYLIATEIQPEGKRRMHFKDYLAGNSIENLTVATV